MSDPIVSAPTRWCEICRIDETCHCPAMKSWCDICCPPRAMLAAAAAIARVASQSAYAASLGEPAPTPARQSLVSRWSA